MSSSIADSQTQCDLELLRRFEPQLRLTQGELFLPCNVADYVAGAALLRREDRGASVIADHGTLTLDRLAELGAQHAGARLSLRGVPGPLGRDEYRRWRKDPARPRFRSSSRFAAVGIVSRVLDSVMRLTLLARGKVPGGYTAAAHQAQLEASDSRATYYGRVSRDGGYVALQYWFFYGMNDWRSTFGGVNDHEADWEQITVLLVDHGPGVEPTPAWVAFSSHDETGDDLRRRWDDPDLELVADTHPVVYAGAGSHSGAYLPGEYLVSVPVPLPASIERTRKRLLSVLPWADRNSPGVAIPYIDYRRGDGHVLGPASDLPWHAVQIDDDVPWVRDYTGLWGLDTQDPLGGERAPAGPRYERDGRVRAPWRMPVAWTGLDKEAPTADAAASSVGDLTEALIAQLDDLDGELERRRSVLRGARVAERSYGRSTRRPSSGMAQLDADVADLRRRQATLQDQLEAVGRLRVENLPPDPVHSHLRHRAVPLDQDGGGRERLLRVWSAATASLLLAALGVVLLWQGGPVLTPVIIIALVMLVVEAALRRRLLRLVLGVLCVAVAVVAIYAVVSLIVGNLRLGIGLLLLLASVYMAWQTLQEGLRQR